MCFYMGLHLIKMDVPPPHPQAQAKLYPATGERNQTPLAMPSWDKISKDFG